MVAYRRDFGLMNKECQSNRIMLYSVYYLEMQTLIYITIVLVSRSLDRPCLVLGITRASHNEPEASIDTCA